MLYQEIMIFKILSILLNILLKVIKILTFGQCPLLVAVNAIIENEDKKILVQFRADTHKFCLPGGLTKIGETLEKAIYREVFEETGFYIKNVYFLFYTDPNIVSQYVLSEVFQAQIESGQIKNSWEGKAEWKKFSDIKNNMAFNHKEIVERYLQIK